MGALYHKPGIHYHAVLDFNGQFPLRRCVGLSLFLKDTAGGAVGLWFFSELTQSVCCFCKIGRANP